MSEPELRRVEDLAELMLVAGDPMGLILQSLLDTIKALQGELQ